MLITVHKAKTNLSQLIDAALAGEEVIIARGRTPVARLTPLPRARIKFGLLPKLAGTGPDFLAPLSEEELADWEGGV